MPIQSDPNNPGLVVVDAAAEPIRFTGIPRAAAATQGGSLALDMQAGTSGLALSQRYYQDNPGADGSGTYAESFDVLLPSGTCGRVSRIRARVDFPAAVGEQALIRLYLYRKVNGVFSYTNMFTAPYTIDNTTDWSVTFDITSLDKGLIINPNTDSIAVSNVYTAGGAPSMRALRVDFEVQPVEMTEATAAGAAAALEFTSGAGQWPLP